MEILNEIFGKGPENTNKSTVFFTDNGSEGYFSKIELLQLARQFKGTWKIGHLKSLFDNMSLKKKLMGPPRIDYERGSEVIWVRFGYGNLRQNLQIPNAGRMHDLILDYANGKLQSVNTLEELLVEAIKVETA